MTDLGQNGATEMTAQALEELARLLREGAEYTGYRPEGSNDRFRYFSLGFRVPERHFDAAEED